MNKHKVLALCMAGIFQMGFVGLYAVPLLLETQSVHQQALSIKGTVIDRNGEALIGVNVKVKGTATGTITDIDGNFSVSAKAGDILSFSYIGYSGKEIVVKDTQFLKVVMEDDSQLLNEVVVIGYGTAKKSDLTGSVESLKGDKLNVGGVTNASQMLQGRVAGLYINSHNQDPGATNSIMLRGVGSMAGSSEPLIVVDGFPSSDASILNTVNPDNIEQIDVLKDASATAIYGSRGANGVIIITTKSGKAGKLSIDYNTKLSVETLGRTVDMMNSDEYIRYYYDLAHDENFTYSFPAGYEGNYYPYPLEAIGTTANTDWQKELTKDTPLTQEHNLSLSGGTESLNYRISANYFDGNSIVGPYEYERFSFDSKIGYRKNKFAFTANVSYTKENTDLNKNSYVAAIHFAPTVGKVDADGALSKFPIASMDWYDNPFYNEYNVDNFAETNTTRLYGTASYEFLPGLKLEGRMGFERRFYEKYYYANERSNALDKGSIDHSNNMNLNTDLILTYEKTLGKHSMNLMGGTNYQTFRNRGNYMDGNGFSSPLVKYYNMNGVLEKVNRNISSFWNERNLLSYMARANYTFDDRYLLTVNFRMDGATQFGPENKWGYFPSVALAWKINKEKFFHCDYFNNLKLKVGYGLSGNANVPSGRSQSLIEYIPVYMGGGVENGVTWNGGYFPNPNLKWEGSKTLNVGLEIGSRDFNLDINAYRKQSYDLLVDRSRPVETGYSSITLNKGELLNYGVEARINGYLSFFNQQLTWNPSVIIAYNYNEITDFDDDFVWNMGVWEDKTFYGNAGCIREGYPLGAIWGYKYDGVWQTNESQEAAKYGAKPGDPKFRDWATSDGQGKVIANQPDGKIDDADRVYQGSQYPSWTASFNNSLTYKNWTLSVMFDGVFDKKVVNYNRMALMNPANVAYGNLSREAMNRWTPDRPDTDIPSFTSPIDGKLAISTFCIEDASFVRLREVTLSYRHTFKPDSFIKGLNVYVTGTNLATITGYSGLNPDVLGMDVVWNLAPITRSYILGIGLSF